MGYLSCGILQSLRLWLCFENYIHFLSTFWLPELTIAESGGESRNYEISMNKKRKNEENSLEYTKGHSLIWVLMF